MAHLEREPTTLFWAEAQDGGAGGLECQGGAIRADQAGVRVRGGDRAGCGQEVRSASAMVREALASAVPARRKKAERKRPKLGGVIPFIDAILEGEARAPRKQRHTAHRIYQRIRVEQSGCEVSESTVRRYVREKKEALGLIRRETFVPQSYEWGSEAQADFYEAYADLGGDRQKLYGFSLRSMASGGAFPRAYPRPTR